MTTDFILEQIIDVVDNHYYKKPATTEVNIIEYVAELVDEVQTLSAEKEALSEQLEDLEENL